MLQVYVQDIDAKLETAVSLGASVATKPTDFYGGKLARFIDPQGNLWWLFEIAEYNESEWESSNGGDNGEDTTWSADAGSDMTYIHDSLVDAMKKLNKYD